MIQNDMCPQNSPRGEGEEFFVSRTFRGRETTAGNTSAFGGREWW